MRKLFKEEWIEEYPFEKESDTKYIYDMKFGSEGGHWIAGSEPYYDFMWVLKEAGIKFKYLEPKYDEEFQTTNLLNDTIVHMWFQRQWSSKNKVSKVHKMGNFYRFRGVIDKIKKKIDGE